MTLTKDPAKVRAGTIGTRKRWGWPDNPRVIRLDSLLPAEQDVIRALLRLRAARDAQQNTPAVDETSAGVSMSEVGDAFPAPTG